MNVGLISVSLLFVAIAVGFVRKANVGILSIGFAMLICILFGSDTITMNAVVSGFGTSLFIQMVGVTYLFAIINSNGMLELMAKKIVNLVPARAIPAAMFAIGMILSAVGPGSIPCLAIIPVVAIPISVSAGISPIMTAIIGDMGAMAGRMSPLTPEAAVVSSLIEEQGLNSNTVPIMICTAVTCVVTSIVVYTYYKGWRVECTGEGGKEKLPAFTWQQWASLAGLVVLAFGVLVLSWNVGLTSFLIGTILIVLGCGDESKAISGVPWGVILMVMGVGMLMNIVTLSGGIDLLVSALESVMNAKSAAPIMAITAGIMSFFSSGLGVVFPTLVPVCSGLANSLGTEGVLLVAMVVIGGTIAGYTPISTTGALIMAGVAQQKDAQTRFPQNKLFMELFAVSFINIIILAIMAALGIYGPFL